MLRGRWERRGPGVVVVGRASWFSCTFLRALARSRAPGGSRGWTSPGASIIRPLPSTAMGVPWAACEMSELISELKEEKEWKSESKHSVGLVLPTRTSWKGRQPDVAPGGGLARSISSARRRLEWDSVGSFALVGGAVPYTGALKTNLPRGGEGSQRLKERKCRSRCGRCLRKSGLWEEVRPGGRGSQSGSGPSGGSSLSVVSGGHTPFISLQRLHFTGVQRASAPKVGPVTSSWKGAPSVCLGAPSSVCVLQDVCRVMSQTPAPWGRCGCGRRAGLGGMACQALRSVGQVWF